MRGLILASAIVVSASLLLVGGNATAREISCDVESDYELHVTPRSVILTRATGTPDAVLMREGRLFVDGQWVALSAVDSQRIAEYERETRAVLPLARQLGRDASEIAFTVLGEVASGFSNDPAATRAMLAKARARLDARLARSISANHFNSDHLGEGIGRTVAELVPSLVGDIVGGAVRAAFSGDTARLQRMENMGKDIEARVEPRAKALERRAEALCDHMRALDEIDDALDYRLPDGRPLDLLEAKARTHDDNARKHPAGKH
jgi:hypothetical protein